MLSALSFLTPFGRARTPNQTTMSWFPVVGGLIGLAVGSLWWLIAKAWPPLPTAALVVVADLTLTGLLHFDGLADAADGLLAPMSRERRLEAMADPCIGAFGAIVVGATLLLRFSAFASMAPSPLVVAGLWCASRTLMTATAQLLPYARPDGLVRDFLGNGERTRRQKLLGLVTVAVGLALAVALVVITRGARGLLALGGELVAMGAVITLSWRRIGGFTGDVLGAAGVIGETIGLLLLVTR